MNRKAMKIIIVVQAVILATLLLAAFMLKRGQGNEVSGTHPATESTQVSVPGVEDSIFDIIGAESTGVTTEPEITEAEKVSVPTETSPETGMLTYESYEAMQEEGQIAFMEAFDSIDAFFEWYNAAKAEYEAQNPVIEIDGAVIDLEELSGSND